MTKIKHFVFNSFGVNAFVVYDKTGEAVIIDGAANSELEKEKIFNFIEFNNITPKYILNTHGHLDHVCGNLYLKQKYGVPILMNSEDNILVETAASQAAEYGLTIDLLPKPDKTIIDGEIIKFGSSEIKALHVPGHSPGSISFYMSEVNTVITGDTLFAGSIGRTDLYRGDFQQLLNSITDKLFTLPPDTLVLPGHGTDTTIRYEKKHNPFF
jgi:glyoxylase-like metal-dependent hydrolase (beta-lactamase superfamily II)